MTDIARALVIGGTGNIGRHVVTLLGERGIAVPPERVELRDIPAVRKAASDADAVFLIWPFLTSDGIAQVAPALAPARRVVYVSAMSVRDDRPPAQNGVWGQVEDAIRGTGMGWTFLRVSGLGTNTLGWAPAIRAGRPVRLPYPLAARSLVHERDVADVAVHALTSPGHAGAAYALTGPASITMAEQAQVLGAAAGRTVRVEQSPRSEARADILTWAAPAWADAALDYWASLVAAPEPVTTTVTDLTGSPARSFEQWARDHADDFRGAQDRP
jgi:uncharacterized protein YbjT (DUF2867 family)